MNDLDDYPPYDNYGNAGLAALEPRVRLEVQRCAACVRQLKNATPDKARWMPHAQLVRRYVGLIGELWTQHDVRTLDKMLPHESAGKEGIVS